MLVLRRKVNEVVVIDDIIEVMVVELRPGKVRIRVSAPSHLPIYRKELGGGKGGGETGRGSLVISRKFQERIVIGDSIEVTVVAIVPGGVRLGFDAPGEMKIIRKEKIIAPPAPNTHTSV